ncbi:hypothetical protein BVY03_03690 [bacterium K02(2017)]|nr:hypothetical protein BVY03_03690 [bacterium K02(2017)]
MFKYLIILLFILNACNQTSKEPSPKVVKQQMVMAVMAIQSNLGAMQDSGYQAWTAQKAVDKLIPLLNTASQPITAQEKKYAQSGRGGIDLKYVKNNPTGANQIVLIADDDEQSIRVEGYGNDLETPIYTDEVQVSSY